MIRSRKYWFLTFAVMFACACALQQKDPLIEQSVLALEDGGTEDPPPEEDPDGGGEELDGGVSVPVAFDSWKELEVGDCNGGATCTCKYYRSCWYEDLNCGQPPGGGFGNFADEIRDYGCGSHTYPTAAACDYDCQDWCEDSCNAKTTCQLGTCFIDA